MASRWRPLKWREIWGQLAQVRPKVHTKEMPNTTPTLTLAGSPSYYYRDGEMSVKEHVFQKEGS